MKISKKAQDYHEKMFPGYQSKLLETDPEFITFFDNFAFDEVVNHDDLDDHTRHLAILAMLIGCQGIDEYKGMLEAAYQFKVTPVEMKEIVYQATAYLGIGRVFPFLHATNDFLINKGIKLPLEAQGQTNEENRLEKGRQAQVDIFGLEMKDYYKSGAPEIQHIHYWLTDHCFGDYYTRTGLDYRQRELITFCFLVAQGGCEAQLSSHIQANIRLGNTASFLIKILSHCIPFIGFPRTLNALKCVQEAQ